ncbi:MAG: hypothetical protein HY877_00585 [Deltaproteobacteria bacterium]|nr:hypothetical protein [Deltaproteobacteria bacterium]
MNWSDYVGWFGFAVVLFSYAQVATRRWRVRSVPNQLGNVIGSGSLGINSIIYSAWVPFFLNLIWALIASFTLLQLLRERNKTMSVTP